MMETLLKLVRSLVGVGEIIVSSDGKIRLQPPKSRGYYLTGDNLDALIRQTSSFSSEATTWRNICIILATSAGIMGVYAIYEKRQRTAAKAREYIADASTDCSSSHEDNSTCVVCMSNQRNVALLECGHVCVCSTCVSQLNLCPVCRQSIDRIVSLYQS